MRQMREWILRKAPPMKHRKHSEWSLPASTPKSIVDPTYEPQALRSVYLKQTGQNHLLLQSSSGCDHIVAFVSGLINYFQEIKQDTLRSVHKSNKLWLTFSLKSSLIIVAVTHLLSELDPSLFIYQINAQIVSILTDTMLRSVFEQCATFDLRVAFAVH